MRIINSQLILNKKVLLRLDLDVPVEGGKIIEDFRLKAGISTLKLCIQNASKVIIIGHLGRPYDVVEDEKNGRPESLSLRPVHEWLQKALGLEIEFADEVEQISTSNSKLIMLENTRFFHGEIPGAEYHHSCISKTCDIDFAKRLASLGEVFINEAFAAYRPAASTTILPTLLPHGAGLRFAKEIEKLTEVRENPKKPLVVIMGGVKVRDKLPVIQFLAQKADAVLVGGKLASELTFHDVTRLPVGQVVQQNVNNILIGKLNAEGTDISADTTESWKSLIMGAKMIIWNGPIGKFEDPKNDQSKRIAQMVLESGAEIIVGGGDTVALLGGLGMLGKYEKVGFVSTGGGAMLKLLSDGTLPTIEVLSK